MLNKLREINTPITAGAFILVGITGVLMFYHLDTGLNKTFHEWVGLIFVAASILHVVTNFKPFKKHLQAPARAALMSLFVIALAVSFTLQPPAGGAKGPKAVLAKLTQVPVEELAALGKKSETDVRAILVSFNAAADADLKRSLSELIDGDPKTHFMALSQIID